MRWRAPILFLAFVGVLFVVWLSKGPRRESAPLALQENLAGPAEHVSSIRALDDADAPEQVPQRESAASTAPEKSAADEEHAPGIESGAVLVVHAIDQTSGTPLQGVRMTLQPPPPASISSRGVDGSAGTLDTSPLTAADGRAEFELPSGTVLHLLAHGAERVGGKTQEIPALTPGERREITLELPTSDDVVYFGRLLSAEHRKPVAGASVRLVRGKEWSSQRDDEEPERHYDETLLSEQVSGPDGLFELSLASWKNPDIRIAAEGFARVFVQVGRDHDSPERAKVVLLARAASLRARLIDAAGSALADGTVLVWTESYNLGVSDHGGTYLPALRSLGWQTNADPSGLCVLPELPPEVPLHVEILLAGQAAKSDLPTLSLSPGEVREVEWTLGSGCRLEGSVVDQAGEAVRNRRIWLLRASRDGPVFFQTHDRGRALETSTDLHGRFHFADVSPGKWWVGPADERNDWDAPDPDGIAPLAELVEVTEGVRSEEVLLRVHVGLYIRGHVLGPAGAGIFVLGSSKRGIVITDVGSDSAFALGPLVPGRYSLVAHGWTHANSEPVTASGGDEGIVLRLTAGARLSGTVLDAATGKGCAAELMFGRADQPKDFGGMSTEADGTFRIEGLAPGTYDLAALASGERVGLLRGVSVSSGSEASALVVSLVPGARLRLKYAGNEGVLRFSVSSSGVAIARDGIPAGGTEETVVPSGLLLVECRWADRSESVELELRVGEEKELVFGKKP